MNAVLDVAGALLLVGGAFFCFAAALGVVRFPDVLTRMHAATKPQVFGLLLVLSGVLLTLRSWLDARWLVPSGRSRPAGRCRAWYRPGASARSGRTV